MELEEYTKATQIKNTIGNVQVSFILSIQYYWMQAIPGHFSREHSQFLTPVQTKHLTFVDLNIKNPLNFETHTQKKKSNKKTKN